MPRWVHIALLAAVIAVLAHAITLLPGGYDHDLSQLGDGRPAAVLVHDHGLVRSTELMTALDEVRGEFEPATLFLVTDPETPEGVELAERHGLEPATLALFDAEGALLARYDDAAQAAALRRFLQEQDMPEAGTGGGLYGGAGPGR